VIRGSNKADIDALLLKYEDFLMGNPENKKMRDLSKGNQRK
jgi:ABC-2 type transport system ATP-binding protein